MLYCVYELGLGFGEGQGIMVGYNVIVQATFFSLWAPSEFCNRVIDATTTWLLKGKINYKMATSGGETIPTEVTEVQGRKGRGVCVCVCK